MELDVPLEDFRDRTLREGRIHLDRLTVDGAGMQEVLAPRRRSISRYVLTFTGWAMLIMAVVPGLLALWLLAIRYVAVHF